MREKLLLVILLIVSGISGCGYDRINLRDACIGVIETNGYRDESRLLIYNDNLLEIEDMPVRYASVGNIFYNPLVYNQELYIIPQGPANRKDEQKVLKINLIDLNEKTYDIEQLAMNSVSTDDEYIYTCNTLNGNSYINKCSKKDRSVNTQVVKQMYISKIVCDAGILYAFGTVKGNDSLKSYIIIFDEKLNLSEQIDITEYGSSHYKAVVHDGEIYFANTLDSKDTPSNTVCVFSIRNKTFDTIQLNQNYPQDLVFYNNFLIVSHYDLVRREGGSISLYNFMSEEVYNYPIECGIEQMTMREENIYILSGNKIYKYKVVEAGIKLEKMIDIDMLTDDSYCSGIFAYDLII